VLLKGPDRGPFSCAGDIAFGMDRQKTGIKRG
jgi:hypothetical protein